MTNAIDDIPVIGGLFKTPKLPKQPDPKVAPTPDEEMSRIARERQLDRRRQGQTTRLNTVLTGTGNQLG